MSAYEQRWYAEQISGAATFARIRIGGTTRKDDGQRGQIHGMGMLPQNIARYVCDLHNNNLHLKNQRKAEQAHDHKSGWLDEHLSYCLCMTCISKPKQPVEPGSCE